ncbi:peptidoglycan-binding protein [Streptomyces sp. NBC_00557]|uniref:peptidoglycan-binding protein n=1 Tax=Streptomyces sp. NBC_00557 TaxID=2975776 RepID=UPI002E81E965|nr:peptidoglycan-binding protein [Streptomyces sp. NBC_00557]WUC36298.1 peptidoglycan-binding protein [Streptomyces sp. NBC_00557]
MTESTGDRRKRLAGLCRTIASAGSKNDLIDAINDALAVSAPVGDTATLESLGKLYQKQDLEDLHKRIDRVARKGLPDVWAGNTSVLASDAVAAAGVAAGAVGRALYGGGLALLTFADALKDARSQDSGGRETLREALRMLGGKDGWFDDLYEDDDEEAVRLNARSVASLGAEDLHQAAIAADDAAHAVARDLNKWVSEARMSKLGTGDLTAVDKLMLAETSAVDGDPVLNEILTAHDLERAGLRMDRLSAADRAAMDRMLAGSDSPQERAYLMKALAAGHSVAEIGQFQGKIHGHDPEWLRRHLTPVVTAVDSMDDEGLAPDGSNNNKDYVTFDGQRWIQGGDGSEGTCVASSTVTARAMVDPLYALGITGGPSGQEDDPEAFKRRLVAEQHRLHTEGHGGDHWEGMGPDGQEHIADTTLGAATGDDYQRHDLGSADDRRAVLSDVEKAVADGRPVPVDVQGKDGAHAMTIIAQDGDRLQVYNPWGTTTWVSENDFINGHMGKAADSGLNDAYSVYLPTAK